MGTREEVDLQIGDIATAVTARVMGHEGSRPVSLAPDETWDAAAEDLGSAARVLYEATVFQVTALTRRATIGTVIATNHLTKEPGMPVRMDQGFGGYVGGETKPNRTDMQLRQAGVQIRHVIDVTDGDPRPGVQVANPWTIVGQFSSRHAIEGSPSVPPLRRPQHP